MGTGKASQFGSRASLQSKTQTLYENNRIEFLVVGLVFEILGPKSASCLSSQAVE